MQRGYVYKAGRNWCLRYWEYQIKSGVKVRVNVHKKLAPIGAAFPNKKSVEPLAWRILEPVNTRLQTPESATPVVAFIENVYLPMAKQFLRASTFKNYSRDEYGRHFKHRLGDIRLRDFRTAHGQRLLAAIAKEHPGMGHKTLLRLKSFLSGVFKHAKAEGYLDDQNPMRDVTLPRTVRRTKYRGPTYTLKEIVTLLTNTYAEDYHSRVAFAVVAVAAFTGLRHSELRGLKWKDLQDGRLSVERTVWRTKEDLPKTESSENTVPILPILGAILDTYRHHLEGLIEEGHLGKSLKPTDWMFSGERRGTSMNLPNLVRRTIIPNLKRYPNSPQWKGWKCFRRSLASNLYALGTKPATIAAILRHADISTTLGWYIEVPESETRGALDGLTALMGQ